MDDPELEAIRAKRLAQLKQQQQSQQQHQRSNGTSGPSQAELAAREEQRALMLSKVMMPEARQRLSRIALVNADKARLVEDNLLGMAQSGQLRERITDEMLVEFLGQIGKREEEAKAKIVFNRRQLDDEDDF